MYHVLKHGKNVKKFTITPAMRTKCVKFINKHAGTDGIITVEIGNLVLPDNIVELITLRYPRRTTEEPVEYQTYSEILALFGSVKAKRVSELTTHAVPERFCGVFDVLNEVDVITTNGGQRTGLTGISRGYNLQTIEFMQTGISGDFNVPESVTSLTIRDATAMTNVSGGKYLRYVDIRRSNIDDAFVVPNTVITLNIDSCTRVTGINGGERIQFIDASYSGMSDTIYILSSVIKLNIRHTSVNTIRGGTELQSVIMTSSKAKGIITVPPFLKNLYLPNSPGVLGIRGGTRLISLNLSYTGVTGIYDIPKLVVYMNISGCNITGVSGGDSVETLDVSNCSIEGIIHISSTVKLIKLYKTNITSIIGGALDIVIEGDDSVTAIPEVIEDLIDVFGLPDPLAPQTIGTFKNTGKNIIITHNDNVLHIIPINTEMRKRLIKANRKADVHVNVLTPEVPINLEQLLTYRYIKKLPDVSEAKEYIKYAELFRLCGSQEPEVVQAEEAIWLDKGFTGTYDIPMGNIYFDATDVKGLTSITGGSIELVLNGSGIKGSVYIQPDTVFANLINCDNVTEIIGHADTLLTTQGDDVVPKENSFPSDFLDMEQLKPLVPVPINTGQPVLLGQLLPSIPLICDQPIIHSPTRTCVSKPKYIITRPTGIILRLIIDKRYNATEDIVYDTRTHGLTIPSNIKHLLATRSTRMLPGATEDKDHINNSELLNRLGCYAPTVIALPARIDVRSTFSGVLDIPLGTRYVFADGCKKLTGIIGCAKFMHLKNTGIRGNVHIHNGTKNIDLTGSKKVTSVSGWASGKMLLSGTSIREVVIPDEGYVSLVDVSDCKNLTYVSGPIDSRNIHGTQLERMNSIK